MVYTKLDLGITRLAKTRSELLDSSLVLESCGGQVPEVCVSASSGERVKQLMDTLCALLDIEKPECDIGAAAEGIVLDVSIAAREAGMLTATILVTAGAVVSGQTLTAGKQPAVVRIASGAQYAIASTIETVFGLPDNLRAGQLVAATPASLPPPAAPLAPPSAAAPTAAAAAALIKADSLGSLEGVKALLKAHAVKVISASIGSVTEANVSLASAVGAAVIAFNTKTQAKAQALASSLGVHLIESDLIYEVASSIRTKLLKRAKASAKIVKVFSAGGGAVYGAKLVAGALRTGQTVTVRKLSSIVFHVTIKSIKRFATLVDTVACGQSFGFTTLESKPISAGDIITEA